MGTDKRQQFLTLIFTKDYVGRSRAGHMSLLEMGQTLIVER